MTGTFRGRPALLLLAVLLSGAGGASARQANPAADTLRLYSLGEVEVVGRQPAASYRLSRRLDAESMRRMGRSDLGEALGLLAGATLQRIGPRNETGLRVRGLDLRHVPLFIDGIPVYSPYDGLTDLTRFTTVPMEQVTLGMGFTSMRYGPNALGGALNLVTREPRHAVEGRLETGWRSGDGREASLALGTRRARWYARGSLAYLRQDSFPVSADFDPAPAENGGRRENAARKDLRWSARLGLTPTPNATYAVGFVDQRAEKGNPPYAGPAVEGSRLRYWQWPTWDKRTLYLLADQAIGDIATVRTRLYADRLSTALFSYDDATYTTQTRPYAFREFGRGATDGGSVLLTFAEYAGHRPEVAVRLTHDHYDVRDTAGPLERYRDATWSASLEDEIALAPGLHAVAGLMWSARTTIEARHLNPEERFPETSRDALDAHAALLADLGPDHRLHAGLARRTRYPTIKDRYSYRRGRALPNPGLEPERSINAEVGYDGVLAEAVQFRTALFWRTIDGVIQSVDVTEAETGRPLAQLRNAGRARHLGGEATAQIRLGRRVRGHAAYAYVHAENRTDPEARFTHIPPHSAHLGLTTVVVRDLTLHGVLTYASGRLSRIEGTVLTELDGYTTLDVAVDFGVRPGVRIETGLRNVLDADYQLVAGYPEPGRWTFVRMAYTFGA